MIRQYWNIKINSNPKEIGDKLESALFDRFVLTLKRDKENTATFKLRRRILYIWYMYFHNWTIVHGKLLKSDSPDITDVKISFIQHWFIILIICSQLLLGLGVVIAIVLGYSNKELLYIPGVTFLALGILIMVVVLVKFRKDIREYKALISAILEPGETG